MGVNFRWPCLGRCLLICLERGWRPRRGHRLFPPLISSGIYFNHVCVVGRPDLVAYAPGSWRRMHIHLSGAFALTKNKFNFNFNLKGPLIFGDSLRGLAWKIKIPRDHNFSEFRAKLGLNIFWHFFSKGGGTFLANFIKKISAPTHNE